MLRTFIAIEAPAAMRRKATTLIENLSPTSANVKWVDDESMHWTIKFLGEVKENRASSICDAMGRALADFPSFELHAHGAGAFPVAERPRTVWLGVDQGRDEMIALHDRIDVALDRLGFRMERRRFRPHMTLGRVRRSPSGIEELGDKIAEHATFDAGTMRVQDVVVFSSRLERRGSVYNRLGNISLTK